MSTTHTVHEDVHEAGLADGCPRCEEHSQHPMDSLDNETLTNLFQRACRGEPGRSAVEHAAMFNIERILMQTVELAKLDKDSYVQFLKNRGVDL